MKFCSSFFHFSVLFWGGNGFSEEGRRSGPELNRRSRVVENTREWSTHMNTKSLWLQCILENYFFECIVFGIDCYDVLIYWNSADSVTLEENSNRSIFWDITPYSPLTINRLFGGTCCLHHQGRSLKQTRNHLKNRWPMSQILRKKIPSWGKLLFQNTLTLRFCVMYT
jgi:hypothetical protein